jgi:hypothetical protein
MSRGRASAPSFGRNAVPEVMETRARTGPADPPCRIRDSPVSPPPAVTGPPAVGPPERPRGRPRGRRRLERRRRRRQPSHILHRSFTLRPAAAVHSTCTPEPGATDGFFLGPADPDRRKGGRVVPKDAGSRARTVVVPGRPGLGRDSPADPRGRHRLRNASRPRPPGGAPAPPSGVRPPLLARTAAPTPSPLRPPLPPPPGEPPPSLAPRDPGSAPVTGKDLSGPA